MSQIITFTELAKMKTTLERYGYDVLILPGVIVKECINIRCDHKENPNLNFETCGTDIDQIANGIWWYADNHSRPLKTRPDIPIIPKKDCDLIKNIAKTISPYAGTDSITISDA